MKEIIKSLTLDRGYWGGHFLWKLKNRWRVGFVTLVRDDDLDFAKHVEYYLRGVEPAFKERWTIENQGIRYLSQRWSLRDFAHDRLGIDFFLPLFLRSSIKRNSFQIIFLPLPVFYQKCLILVRFFPKNPKSAPTFNFSKLNAGADEGFFLHDIGNTIYEFMADAVATNSNHWQNNRPHQNPSC